MSFLHSEYKRFFTAISILLLTCCFNPLMAQTEWDEGYEEEDPYSRKATRTYEEEDLYNGRYKRRQNEYNRDDEFSARGGSISIGDKKEKKAHQEDVPDAAYHPDGNNGDGMNPSNGTGTALSPKEEDMQGPPPPPTEPNVPVSDAIPLVIVSGIGYAIFKLRRPAL